MAANYIETGDVLPWTNGTGSAVDSGDPVAFGTKGVGVALVDIANAAIGSVSLDGVFQFPKNTSDAVSQGAPVWWDVTAGEAVNVPTLGCWFMGYASEAELAAATTVNVTLEEFAEEQSRVITLAATGAQTLTAQDFYSGKLTVLVANTAAKTINLPAVASVPLGAELWVVKTGGGAYALTLDPNASETIAGGATHTALDADNDQACFVSTGAAWLLKTSTIA